MTEISACPFCGSNDVETAHEDVRSVGVFCGCCFARGPLEPMAELAIMRWNNPQNPNR